jgi:cell division protein FtsB
MADEQRPHLHVEFYMDTREIPNKSREAGRPIYEDIEMVKIRFAGDKYNVHVAPANEYGAKRDPMTNQRLTYAQQFPEHYRAFKDGIEFHGSGTPLSEAPFLTMAKRKELEAANVFTLEALAGLDGTFLQKLGMGARELKNQAEAYLETAKGTAVATKLAAENEAMKAQMEALKAQMAELIAAKGGDSGTIAVEPQATGPSPFDSWDDETIRLWIEEQGGEKPHHKCSHETLVAKADELNAALAKQQEAA